MGRKPDDRQSTGSSEIVELKWTSKAVSDVGRLHDFLARVHAPAAARTIQSFMGATTGLLVNPRIGERLEEFSPREIRRIFIGQYEVRYEIVASTVYVMRLWHTREVR